MAGGVLAVKYADGVMMACDTLSIIFLMHLLIIFSELWFNEDV